MQAPKWTEFPKYPVITIASLMAIGVTVAWWAKVDISLLFESAEIRRGQFWRLVTSVLPHLDILHLLFNLYWLWILGTTVERVYGHLRTVFLFLLFAVGSNSLDFALAGGGVGLSGIGYGLFGLLWILSERDERFKDAIDRRTVNLFIGWFFLCVVLTVTHTWAMANVAHAAGAILGILVGFAITMPDRRLILSVCVAAFVSFGLWGATIGRPAINFSSRAGFEEARWGYDALQNQKNQEAVRWLQDAVRYQPKNADMWFDLGIAYHRLGNLPAAMAAYQRAHQLNPANPDYENAAGQPN
jgi:membrane associated rhomboid family serine protease